jgi:aminoglycoside 3-N-acetyltransferase
MKTNDLATKIKKTISKLGIKKGSTLYIAGNLYNFGIVKSDIYDFCEYFVKNLKIKISSQGNIVVPTATLNFTNSNRIYNPKKTKSYQMGIFSEYIRSQKNSYRSDHPLWSFSGIGRDVKRILNNISFSAYGEGSVFQKLLNHNTYFISLGEPHSSIGMIHYVEHLVGVPYRYNKEFIIKVKKDNKIKKQYALLGVRFKSKKMTGDGNEKIISKLINMNTFKIYRFKKGKIYICKYDKIIQNLKIIFNENPRIWLKNDKTKQKNYYAD